MPDEILVGADVATATEFAHVATIPPQVSLIGAVSAWIDACVDSAQALGQLAIPAPTTWTGVAPEGTQLPYVITNFESSPPLWNQGGPSFVDESEVIILVHSGSAEDAESVAEAAMGYLDFAKMPMPEDQYVMTFMRKGGRLWPKFRSGKGLGNLDEWCYEVTYSVVVGHNP